MQHKSRLLGMGVLAFLLSVKSTLAAPNDYRENYEQIFRLQLVLSVVIILAVLALAGVMLKKFHAGKAIKPAEITVIHNMKLEIAWTVIATILVLFLFVSAMGPTEQFASANNKQADVTIVVTARQFSWNFEFEGVVNSSFNSVNVTTGELNPLILDSGTSYLFKVTSQDVIHSFFVPDLGFKVDAVPGHTNYVYLDNIAPGEYRIVCAEFCGAGHYNMPGLIIVR